jgi:cytochrome c556
MINRTIRLLAIGILFAQNAHGADQQAPPPTKWDSRVTDTFFPDARKALNGERPKWLSPNAAALSSGKTGGEKPSAAGDDTAVGAFAWSKLVSPESLADEVKSLNTELIDEVKTQQAFLGGANKKSRRTLSMLAVTFGIINEYAGEVKWKAQAIAARDLFSRAGFNCKAATEQTFREAKQRSDDLSGLLRGESIKATSSAETSNEWSKIADRAQLMSRLELAQRDRIAPWTANSGEFKKNAAALRHEAEIVAALAEVVSRPGYDYADDEKYRGYAKSLQQSALELRTAIQNENYESAHTAAGTLSKACANCHGDFR